MAQDPFDPMPRAAELRTTMALSRDEAIVVAQRRNWQAASPFATRDVRGRPFKYATRSAIDPGIAPFVQVLYDHGVETYESCQGGPDPARPDRGHAYLEPTIAFHGGPEAGPRAYAIARLFDLPVADVRRVWRDHDHELVGPHWEMTFRRQAGADDRVRLGYREPRTPRPRRRGRAARRRRVARSSR